MLAELITLELERTLTRAADSLALARCIRREPGVLRLSNRPGAALATVTRPRIARPQ